MNAFRLLAKAGATVLMLIGVAGLANAQFIVNPWVGRPVVTTPVVNPWTGRVSHAPVVAPPIVVQPVVAVGPGVAVNPWIGTVPRRARVYNPWTGRTTSARVATNPWTGQRRSDSRRW